MAEQLTNDKQPLYQGGMLTSGREKYTDGPSVQKPSVGRIVHYVSYGTPNAEYESKCRAAIVTELSESEGWVSLCVLNPTGQFFNNSVPYNDPTVETLGDKGCATKETHGSPFRFCACGWKEAAHIGGTWHWPERV